MTEWRYWLSEQRGTLLAIGIFLVMFLIYSTNHPAGFSVNMVQTAANKATLLAFVAMAQAIVVITAGIDLSVGMILTLTNCLASWIVVGTATETALGVIGVLGTGLVCGMINGAIVIFGRLQPSVTTIATGAMYYGIALFLQPVSRTFHGRDVFAPVAGHLAAGLDPAQVGPVVDPATLVRIDLPPAQLEQGHVRATAMAIDRFGNVALSVRGAELDRHGLATGARIEISAADSRYFALRARTFADVRVGEMVVFDDSSGWAALAMNSGSIIDICDIERGDVIDLRLR